MLNVLFHVGTGADNAVRYYRQITPGNKLSEVLGHNTYLSRAPLSNKSFFEAVQHSDVVVGHAATGTDFLHYSASFQKVLPVETPEGMRYPPVFIYDTDDDYDFIHPMNMAFARSGYRDYPAGNVLTPGDMIEIEYESGERSAAWVDEETYHNEVQFDIARNIFEAHDRHSLLRTGINGVTVSVPALRDHFRDVLKVTAPIHVLPNMVVPEDYAHKMPIQVVRKPGNVRVFFQGGMAHYADLYPIREAIRAVAQKYPNTTWVFYGDEFKWIHDAIPPAQLEYHTGNGHAGYLVKRPLFAADINLCPLRDDRFNRGKSAIKWYEGTLADIPEATVAARVATFSEIEDGKTGMLYSTPEEFAQKLSLLIEQEELRRTIGENARDWVRANRSPAAVLPGLVEFYQEVIDMRRAALAPKIISASPRDVKQVLAELRAGDN